MTAPTDVRALHDRIAAIPTREEYLGGQRTQYVQRDTVLFLVEQALAAVPPTPPDVVALERLAREATPGPWHACLSDRYGPDVPPSRAVVAFETPDGGKRGLFTEVPWPDGEPVPRKSADADAAYIAAAHPQAVLALIAGTARLTAARDAWMASSAGYGSDMVEWKVRAQVAEQELTDIQAAWKAAADQAKDYIEKHGQERIARKAAEQESARLRAQIDTLRSWMSEYPNDKYTGAWWLAEFDRIAALASAEGES